RPIIRSTPGTTDASSLERHLPKIRGGSRAVPMPLPTLLERRSVRPIGVLGFVGAARAAPPRRGELGGGVRPKRLADALLELLADSLEQDLDELLGEIGRGSQAEALAEEAPEDLRRGADAEQRAREHERVTARVERAVRDSIRDHTKNERKMTALEA